MNHSLRKKWSAWLCEAVQGDVYMRAILENVSSAQSLENVFSAQSWSNQWGREMSMYAKYAKYLKYAKYVFICIYMQCIKYAKICNGKYASNMQKYAEIC